MEDHTALPDYSQMIMAAIEALEGPNESAISDYMESNNSDLPADHSTLLSDALQKMKESAQLVLANGTYTKPDLESPPKRGRGRPRKNKSAAPAPAPAAASGSAGTRSRGRPPKAKDPEALTPEPKKANSVGRPRGRPAKKTETAEATPVGVKRGRGRPPKVTTPVAAATVGA